jgi:hypothetical protein
VKERLICGEIIRFLYVHISVRSPWCFVIRSLGKRAQPKHYWIGCRDRLSGRLSHTGILWSALHALVARDGIGVIRDMSAADGMVFDTPFSISLLSFLTVV